MCLYTDKQLSENVINGAILPSKRIKYFILNLARKVRDMYTENYEILMKETKEKDRNMSCVHKLEELILSNVYLKWSTNVLKFLL